MATCEKVIAIPNTNAAFFFISVSFSKFILYDFYPFFRALILNKNYICGIYVLYIPFLLLLVNSIFKNPKY